MTAVGFEPTQLALVELESTPLDHSGKLSLDGAICLETLTVLFSMELSRGVARLLEGTVMGAPS